MDRRRVVPGEPRAAAGASAPSGRCRTSTETRRAGRASGHGSGGMAWSGTWRNWRAGIAVPDSPANAGRPSGRSLCPHPPPGVPGQLTARQCGGGRGRGTVRGAESPARQAFGGRRRAGPGTGRAPACQRSVSREPRKPGGTGGSL